MLRSQQQYPFSSGNSLCIPPHQPLSECDAEWIAVNVNNVSAARRRQRRACVLDARPVLDDSAQNVRACAGPFACAGLRCGSTMPHGSRAKYLGYTLARTCHHNQHAMGHVRERNPDVLAGTMCPFSWIICNRQRKKNYYEGQPNIDCE